MIKIHLANILLICFLGTLFLWPEFKIEPQIDKSVSTAYQSVCQITTGKAAGSGVLLESGYVLTASHCIDRNLNDKLEDNEKVVKLTFPNIKFETDADVVHVGKVQETDIAILKPREHPPLIGVKLMSSEEYNKLNTGAPLYTIGMQSGLPKANITDGRLIDSPSGESRHRNSSNTYKGNSGGGVFIGDKLVGIASQVGVGEHHLYIPIFHVKEHERMLSFRQIMKLPVPYTFPMANQSVHVPVPAIRGFLGSKEFETDPLWEEPIKCPYEEYYSVLAFNAGLAAFLMLIFLVMRKRWK